MQFLHLILCLLILLSGLMVAFSSNPVESVLFLILTFFIAGTTLFLFNAEFFGLILIVVYVGAIAVLFLFVIMMLNLKIYENFFTKNINNSILVLFIFFVMSIVLFIFLNGIFNNQKLPLDVINDVLLIDNLNNIDVLGQVLYNYYLASFLVAGLILLVALVGSIVLTLRFNREPNKQLISRQLARTDNFLAFFK
jgi:NADH-quinone oxidoreductase subunit J